MAVAKKVKPASGNTKNKKSSPAKPAPKPAAKPVKKTAPTKSAAKPTPKKVETKSSKSVSKPATKTAAKPASSKEPAKKQTTATKVPVAKTQIKKEVAKTKQATPVKSVSPAKKEPVTTKPLKSASPAAKSPSSKPASDSAKSSAKNAPSKQTAGAKDSGKKEKLKTPDPAELAKEFPDMDPADLKAQKIIKELEETMDLAAVKPRIKVPTVTKTIVKRDHHNAPLKLVEPTNTNKQKFQLEFEFRSSPKILFNALSDSSGLQKMINSLLFGKEVRAMQNWLQLKICTLFAFNGQKIQTARISSLKLSKMN
jgi:hypothetical protein